METDKPVTALPNTVTRLIHRHSLYAVAGALIPVPMIEVVTSTSAQIHLVAQLCDIYQVRFSDQAIKASLATFASVALPASGLGAAAYMAARAVPVIGPLLSLTTAPVLAGAMTWAVGRVFAWHFEKGGTIEDFRTADAVDRFKQEFAEGKRRAAAFIRT